MNPLRDEVQEFQERWNSMVLDITEDLKITCDEARAVRKWLMTERRAYGVLKKRINLEIRTVRNDYELRLKSLGDRFATKEMRLDMAKIIHPYKTLALAVEELLLKADEMELRMERVLRQCE
jgi:hypothetical protein